ncbi:MAG: hypothetical protein ABFR50_09890, partial [Candidatus Fermentibacteria bacterium]
LIAAVAASLIAVPSLALAQPSPGNGPRAGQGEPAPHAKGKRGKKGPGAKARHQFPMAGAKFVQLVDQRIAVILAASEKYIQHLTKWVVALLKRDISWQREQNT